MFREQLHETGHVTLHSPLLHALGVPHGFTTAVGGLRIGTTQHLRPVLAALNLADLRVVMTRQVHGDTVTISGARCDEADAHVTDHADELVAVRTADCVPLLLADEDGARVAAVHAGWRGLLAGVIEAALRYFEPDRVTAAIGPCISVEHYEVGLEVAARFEHGVVPADFGKPRLDLRAVVIDRLLLAGVASERIDVCRRCTFAEAEHFHSYRRQGTGCGHMAAFVGPR